MSDTKVVNFSDKRKAQQDNMKREYERILYKQLLGGYTLIENLGLKGVELNDISKTGCMFTMDPADGSFNEGEEIDFRFYFSSTAYIPAKLKIVRVEKIEDGYSCVWSYGCQIDTSYQAYPALEKFVDFLEAFGKAARKDSGEEKVWSW